MSRVFARKLLRDFHRTYPETDLDVVTLFDSDTAIAAVRSGTIDATFRVVSMPGRQLPDGIEATPVFDEPLHLFTGPAHEFVRPRDRSHSARRAPDLDARQHAWHRVGRLL